MKQYVPLYEAYSQGLKQDFIKTVSIKSGVSQDILAELSEDELLDVYNGKLTLDELQDLISGTKSFPTQNGTKFVNQLIDQDKGFSIEVEKVDDTDDTYVFNFASEKFGSYIEVQGVVKRTLDGRYEIEIQPDEVIAGKEIYPKYEKAIKDIVMDKFSNTKMDEIK